MGGLFSRIFKSSRPPPPPPPAPIPDDPLPIKLVILGPTAAGKTSMLITQSQNTFNEEYAPTVLDVFKCQRQSHGRGLAVQIIDTSGEPHMTQQRSLLLSGADVVMICVSTGDEKMPTSVKDFNIEARNVCGNNTPMVLVGTKTDLRD